MNDITGVVQNAEVARIQDNILDVIINPILALATTVSVTLFIWGLVKFLISRSKGDTAGLEKGKKHIIYGIIALFILLSIWSIFITIGKFFNSKVWFVN